MLTGLGELPIGHQLILMNLDPCLHQLQLLGRESTGQNTAIDDGNGRFFSSVTHVNMCEVMPVRVLKEHGYQNTIEHADGGHWLIV